MRTETDEFKHDSDYSCDISAFDDGDEVKFYFGSYATEKLTKDQAREFARQLLELCGDE